MILLSYAAFTFSFACQIMYVIQHQMLKRKIWGKRLLRFGALSKLDSLSFIAISIAWPFFLIGLILRIYLGISVKLTFVPLLDAKVISSLLVFGVYSVYLYQRVVKYVRGYNMALLGIAGFLILLINYILSGQYSNFHIWY